MLAQRFLITAVIAVCSSIPAFATLQTYSSLSSFQTATSTDTFSNLTFVDGSLGTSTTVDGVVFSTTAAGLTGSASPSGWPTGASDPALVSSAHNGGSTLTVSIPSGVNAVDFYVGPQDFVNFTISVTDDAGGTFTSNAFIQSALTNPVFFGVTTTGNFTSFQIITFANPDMATLDDVQIGQADVAPTPEAATLLLVGTGLLGMGYFKRRRRSEGSPVGPRTALATATA